MKRSQPPRRSRTPIARSGKPITRTPVPRQNKARKLKEFARTYHSGARVLLVKLLPCAVPGCVSTQERENAHTQNGGLGRKGDYQTIIPLCRTHHSVLDCGPGHDWFERNYQVNLAIEARLTEQRWQAHLAGEGA